ncbi:hypothetical protein PVAND_011719 [Polypedilum vanderplanki]|uniref:Exonuclease domain-containing protein n=1 Tax=Polypedilum vanderplanki TaxID=319348 RepID=A0A9J6CL25_POLVA|nr:hypothetical protein PVAND_011719 [Polypedilum vanderplanki]
MNNLQSITDQIEEVEKLLKEQKAKRIRKKLKKKEIKDHPYIYLLCIDFEATCFDMPTYQKRKIQEIIEFPAVLINLQNGVIESEFHRYVRPTEIGILSEYCTNLTKISQATVDSAKVLQDVIEEFRIWLKELIKEKNLIMPKTKKSNLDGNCCICTWTNWDILIQLRNECNRKQLKKLSVFNQWMDLKEIFINERCSPKEQYSFSQALAKEGIEFIGQPHSGIDDARMTARLAYKLHTEGSYLRITRDMNHYSKINRPF